MPMQRIESGLGFDDLAYPAIGHLSIDGLDIAYIDRGRGARALLLIHGLGSYLKVWTRNLEALSACHRVVAIDLPGYGRSSKRGVSLSMEFFARVLDRVIDVLDLMRVTLIGHSMGGQIALWHALLYPGKAEALVLLAPAGFERFTDTERRLIEGLSRTEVILGAKAEVVRANLRLCFHHIPAEARFLLEDRLAVMGGPDHADLSRALSSSVRAMLDGPVFPRLREIQAPVLVMFGMEDRLIPNRVLHPGLTTSDIAALGVAELSHARLQLLPETGHMLQLERPEAVNQAILSHLSRL